MPKTEKKLTLEGLDDRLDAAYELLSGRIKNLEEGIAKIIQPTLDANSIHISNVESRADKALDRLGKLEVKCGQPKGATIEVDLQTRRKLGADAQFLNLRSADELAQIVLHAYLQMREEESPAIEFPLCLTTVKSA